VLRRGNGRELGDGPIEDGLRTVQSVVLSIHGPRVYCSVCIHCTRTLDENRIKMAIITGRVGPVLIFILVVLSTIFILVLVTHVHTTSISGYQGTDIQCMQTLWYYLYTTLE
jgi:hypothetical protein